MLVITENPAALGKLKEKKQKEGANKKRNKEDWQMLVITENPAALGERKKKKKERRTNKKRNKEDWQMLVLTENFIILEKQKKEKTSPSPAPMLRKVARSKNQRYIKKCHPHIMPS